MAVFFQLLDWELGSRKRAKCATAIKEAIRCGYRHIDCAYMYGNQKEIGQALKECFQEGLCKREDLFITSKLWNDSHHFNDVGECIARDS